VRHPYFVFLSISEGSQRPETVAFIFPDNFFGSLMLSHAELRQQLSDLGLRAGDLVIVHASMRKIGPVDGGAGTLLGAILSAVGADRSLGTVVMLLGSRDGDVFDPNSSPAAPEMGVLAEIFRQYPGVRVSDHPACRCAAAGVLSPDLTAPGPLHDYYGPGSFLAIFLQHQGKILRLGANIDTVTLTHHAEYLAQVSPKKRITRTYITRDRGKIAVESLDDSAGIQQWPGGDYFGQITADYLGAGNGRQGRVGQCKAELLDGPDFCRFAVTWMEHHLAK
jgi:aminoglycoside N3'-acetyltransferase